MLIDTGVISKEDLNTINNELNPFFDEKKFGKSQIYSQQKVALNIRDSESFFPPLDQVPDTSIILQLMAKRFFKKYLLFDGMVPDIQLLRYGPNQFYNWHSDIIPRHHMEFFSRIITVSLNLNDEYTGGGLEIKTDKTNTLKIPNQAGSYVIFPSFLVHRAISVETGCRKAVTLWIKGHPENIRTLIKCYNDHTKL